MPKRLTETSIAGTGLPQGRREVWLSDAAVPGLRLRITPGARTFYYSWRDRLSGQARREKIGAWGALTLEQARDAARRLAGAIAAGEDPRAKRLAARAEWLRQAEEEGLKLGLLIDEWQRLHLGKRRPSYREEAPAALRRAFAEHLDRPAARLSRQAVINVLDRMAEAGKVAMHVRVRAYGHACFRWAMRRGKVSSNPFADLPDYGGVPARDRVLSDEELGAVWRAAEAMPYPFGPLLRLLTLTLCRREEVAKARWSEVSRDLTTWTIPSERMKRGRAHVVALPAAARAILAGMPRFEGCDWVFTTNGRTAVSGFSAVKKRLDRISGVSDWRLHDLRRTGVSALARLGVDAIVADMLLAHQPSRLQGAARVYQQHDFGPERARALEVWAAHVARCAAGEPAPSVVRIEEARQALGR